MRQLDKWNIYMNKSKAYDVNGKKMGHRRTQHEKAELNWNMKNEKFTVEVKIHLRMVFLGKEGGKLYQGSMYRKIQICIQCFTSKRRFKANIAKRIKHVVVLYKNVHYNTLYTILHT